MTYKENLNMTEIHLLYTLAPTPPSKEGNHRDWLKLKNSHASGWPSHEVYIASVTLKCYVTIAIRRPIVSQASGQTTMKNDKLFALITVSSSDIQRQRNVIMLSKRSIN